MGVHLAKNKGGYVYLENPKEQLMEMLVDKTLALGHLLSFREACEDPELIDPNNYAFYFGSFGEAAKIAWKRATNPQRGNKPTDSKIELPPSSNTHQGGFNQTRNKHPQKPRSRTGKYTYREIKKLLVDFYKENDRLPKQAEVMSNPNMPCWATLYRILGDREEWYRIVKAELEKEESLQLHKDEPASQGDTTLTEEQMGVFEDSSSSPSAIGLTIKPIINAKYHWEGDILQVEFRVVKPGNARPVYITLSV